MDSTEYSYADLGTNALDKTTGGVSKLAGITFGTDEESFHSDEFDRELGKALAVGQHDDINRRRLKIGSWNLSFFPLIRL